MSQRSEDEVRTAVRENYAKVAQSDGSCGCAPGCCAPGGGVDAAMASQALGYSAGDVTGVPQGANLGLGCGNPLAMAALQQGETVLDLGSGAGFDCFLASARVGPTGRVIGVDMTPEMITKARANAKTAGARNVEFRLGEIERLPVADGSVDVILSNCVINLAPDKKAVFEEAFRVLKPGGRLAISDIVQTGHMPDALKEQVEALVGCVAGAAGVDVLESMLRAAGFEDVTVQVKPESRSFIRQWMPGTGAENHVASATLEARKAGAARGCCGPSCCAGTETA